MFWYFKLQRRKIDLKRLRSKSLAKQDLVFNSDLKTLPLSRWSRVYLDSLQFLDCMKIGWFLHLVFAFWTCSRYEMSIWEFNSEITFPPKTFFWWKSFNHLIELLPSSIYVIRTIKSIPVMTAFRLKQLASSHHNYTHAFVFVVYCSSMFSLSLFMIYCKAEMMPELLLEVLFIFIIFLFFFSAWERK